MLTIKEKSERIEQLRMIKDRAQKDGNLELVSQAKEGIESLLFEVHNGRYFNPDEMMGDEEGEDDV